MERLLAAFSYEVRCAHTKLHFFSLNGGFKMNSGKLCGFVFACICDLIFICSEQGGHHIKLSGYICFSSLPLPRTALC